MPNAGRAAAVADIAKPVSLLPVHEMCGLLSTRPVATVLSSQVSAFKNSLVFLLNVGNLLTDFRLVE